jgi:hypothetical protein
MSEEVKSASEQKKEDWMNSKWRPMMGWMYMVVCTMDMVIFPILWSLLQTLTHSPITQWNPLTLQGAGLFHIAMGAVLGIAAFGRTQEKLNDKAGATLPSTTAPAPSFGATAPSTSFTPAPSWGTTPTAPAVKAPAPAFGGAAPAMSSTGKPMPVQPEQPEL